MADRWVRTFSEPPKDNSVPTAALLIRDVDDIDAIAAGDVLVAKWKVEVAPGKSVRLTVGEIIAHVSAGSLSLPTFALRTAYPRLGAFVNDSILYRVLTAINAANTDDIDALLAANAIEALGGAGLTVEQTAILTRVAGFDIRDFRAAVPTPPFTSQTELFKLAQKTIGIGRNGLLYSFEHTEQEAPTTTWQDFDDDSWQFEQTRDLPISALQTGDFFYIPNGGTSPERGIWRLYDGTRLVTYDDVGTFLTGHHFLGNFTSQEAAANAIVGYDSAVTYLAYFPVPVMPNRFPGREVQQLTGYTPGQPAANRWVPSDEELHHLIANVEAHIRAVDNKTVINSGVIDGLQTEVKAILEQQDDQDEAIGNNKNAIDNLPDPPTQVSNRDALRGSSADPHLFSSKQVRSNVKGAWTQEASADPELDTLHIRYAAIDYNQIAYDADNLGFAQMMFNNATLASSDKLKISYFKDHKIGAQLDLLNTGSKIQLLDSSGSGLDYEEPTLSYSGEITAVARVERAGLDELSVIELTLDTNPSIAVGLGPNTEYFVAVSGKFANKLATDERFSQKITDADIDTSDPSNESKVNAPSRQAVAEEIKRVEDEFSATGSGLSQQGVDGRIDRRISDADIDTNDPSNESKVNAPSRQAVAEEIKRVEGEIPDVSGYQTQSQVTEIANARAKARYSDAEKTAVSNIPSNDDIATIANARAAARYTNTEKTKLANVEPDAKDDQNAADVPVSTSGFSNNLSSADNTVQKALDTIDDLSISGESGITTEENRFERVLAGGAVLTNIRFRVFGQGALPARDNSPRTVGTSWEIDYRDVAGKLIVFEPNTSPDTTFEINLQDLLAIRSESIGTDLDGSLFLIANKTNRTGSFTANPAIAQVFPAATTLSPNSLALITMNSIGDNGPAQTYELIVQPLGGEGEDDKETLYGTGVPAGTLGEIGDSYIRRNTSGAGMGQVYKKTGSSTWTLQIDLATQAELDAVNARLVTAESEIDTLQTDLSAAEVKIAALEDTHQTLTSAAAITWNVDDGEVADLTLGHNVTLTIAGGDNGDTAMLRCLQDATGSRTLALASAISRGGRAAPTLRTAASERDYLLFTKIGTSWVYLGIISDE